jgi:hypothetical protein
MGSRGTKEQLIIDAIVTGQSYYKHRNISIAWIDYPKAFDSIPHSWLLKVLSLYRIDNSLISFLQLCMSRWQTVLSLSLDRTNITTDPIQIRRGIFQGDSLSPLWFCLALNPLSKLLNQTGYGFQLKSLNSYKITHLFYMDDLKLYTANQNQLHSLLEITRDFSKPISMEFGIDKCSVLQVNAGKIHESSSIELLDHVQIPSLRTDSPYKYLGMLQLLQIKTRHKKSLENSYMSRVTKILKSEFNSYKKFTAINTGQYHC